MKEKRILNEILELKEKNKEKTKDLSNMERLIMTIIGELRERKHKL